MSGVRQGGREQHCHIHIFTIIHVRMIYLGVKGTLESIWVGWQAHGLGHDLFLGWEKKASSRDILSSHKSCHLHTTHSWYTFTLLVAFSGRIFSAFCR